MTKAAFNFLPFLGSVVGDDGRTKKVNVRMLVG
jgi:hypothetical protein